MESAETSSCRNERRSEMNELLRTFVSQGYVVLPGVLARDQIDDAISLFTAHRHTNPGIWRSPKGEPGPDIGDLYGSNGESGRWVCQRPFADGNDSFDAVVSFRVGRTGSP